ncbi:MAG: acyl-CoA thioester hydrolase/BAAT C-terminal domain-containing protein, partial [Pseudomonadota bacterium]
SADAVFEADASGCVDTASSPAISGAYEGVDVGGPFWATAPAAPRGAYLARLRQEPEVPLAPVIDPLAASLYRIEALRGQETLGAVDVVRRRLADGVRHEVVAAGRLRGHYFEPADGPGRCAVLVLGGSEGGVIPTRAASLAAEGIPAMALGYFDYLDRPKAAINLPIEYFVEALEWLAARAPSIRLGVWGSSRGSEAAFLTAAAAPDVVSAVIGWVPSHVVNNGFDMTGGVDFAKTTEAMWTHAGRPYPYLPGGALGPELLEKRRLGLATPPGYRFADEFALRWGEEGVEDRYGLPLEAVNASVLLVSGEDDAIWPSTFGAERIARRWRRLGKRHPLKHVSYAGVGHAIGVPNEPRPFSDIAHWSGGYSGVANGFVAYGGSPAANARAARKAWPEATGFLKSTLL